MKKKIYKLLLPLILILPCTSYGESSVFALVPGSIGEHHYAYSTAALGRGGFAMAFPDSLTLNQMNYALWSFIPRTTFSLSASYQGLKSESETNSISSYDGTFLGGYLAIPIIRRKMAIGFGVIPKSINNQGFFIKDVGIGAKADQTLKVKGTLSEVQVIASYAPVENLSIGFFTYYILGKITDMTRIEYTDRSYQDVIIENQYHFYGLGPSIGLSVFYKMTPWLSVGARYKFPTKMEVYAQQVSITTEKTIEKFQEVTFPANLTLGFSFQPLERWVLGADVDYVNWNGGYLFDGVPVRDMNDNFRIGMGIERLSSRRRLVSYADRMTYRAGVFYGQLNFLANDQPVDEYGISLGFGFPISQASSRLDIALQAGKRGDLSINGLSEMFFRLNFSLSANELWFVREDR